MEGRAAPVPRTAPQTAARKPAASGFVTLEGEEHYRIAAYDQLEPFLMTVASDTDLWMFVSSRGGLTAGRVDPDGSLFPYVTADRLHDAHCHSGPVTLIQVEDAAGRRAIWEPFAEASAEHEVVERNLYKNALGNRLVFEEIRRDLGLGFRYAWAACDEFGWVRTATLENRGPVARRISLLDGVRNVLPHGAPLILYQQTSNLVDAYKKSEADPESGLGIFSLTAGITDRAEALESLTANVVWCCGLEGHKVHLSLEALAAFRHGRVVPAETVLNGARGNYLVSSRLDLDPGEAATWRLICDAGRDHVQIAALRRDLVQDADLPGRISRSLSGAGENLRRNVGSADGLQVSRRPETWWRHAANVLFNNMRGGVFWRGYDLPVDDLRDFLRVRNAAVAERHGSLLGALPPEIPIQRLIALADGTGDPDFRRLAYEYLPLHFGRRHGDPSRPWNSFRIRGRDRDGGRRLHYEGNWRDIFQNWEALCTAFPGFLPSVIAKFVNASTVDGFNPYHVTRDGVAWETASPDQPWSNIGYWGDHQIIYLLKLLEALDGHEPDTLGRLLGAEIFSYVDVPYRLKPYREILEDPRATIRYDTARAALVADRVAGLGTDGKLLRAADGSTYHANLFEKLLVPALSKLSNLIPDAGIWMNTQRPEWNDANNALGGGGVSAVTLCYLRRYLAFLADRLESRQPASLPVSSEVAAWFEGVESVLADEKALLAAPRLDSADRKRVMDRLGGAFSAYREAVYARGFSGRTGLGTARAAGLCRLALAWLDWGVAANRRDDGLYHSYNLLEIAPDGTRAEVGRLPVMLEGQVAALSSGALDAAEAAEVLERLFTSPLYSPARRTFLLYPERELPGFMARNVVPEAPALGIPLLGALLTAGESALLARDAEGILRFPGTLRNARDLEVLLDRLGADPQWSEAVARDRGAVVDLFESVFRHKSYTGRSGVMYAYEGLGCVYWHMVAKLLLAAQENFWRAEREGRPASLRAELVRHYYRVRSGLGHEQTAAEYGAFPADPYSHTPARGGAKQPGMTGQVKEEILTRLGELGVRVENGALSFRPALLRADELLARPAEYGFFDVGGSARTLPLPRGSLAFTHCQVPVVYERVSDRPGIRVFYRDGTRAEHAGDTLDARTSAELFSRSGRIERLEVRVPAGALVRFERPAGSSADPSREALE